MAKQESIGSDQQISLTFEQLQELIETAHKKQNNEPNSNELFSSLIAAVIESRKPYVDPAQVENEASFKEANRAALHATRENIKRIQDNCPHKKGLGGQTPGDDSAFWIHRTDTGETIGICSYCQKVISTLIPEDAKFFAMKGANVPSSAAQRNFLNPIKALTARFPEEERKQITERLTNLSR